MNNCVTTRATDIFAVRWAMKYLLHVRNRVHHYNLLRLFSAIDRPKGVGLLTVCNHVSTLDSASIVPSIIPLRTCLSTHSLSGNMLTSRNCGFWNLAAEEILFSTPLKNRISSIVKVFTPHPLHTKIMPIDRNGGVFQPALSDFTERVTRGDWVHMFPEGRTYQDQLKSCRDSQGRRIRKSGRTAPPGRDLGPLKWGVGKVIFDAITKNSRGDETWEFANGVNNGKLMVLPYYHLNMERILPEDEDLKLISMIPGKGADVYCMIGEPIDFSDIVCVFHKRIGGMEEGEEKKKVEYECYKAITDRVEQVGDWRVECDVKELERVEYALKDLRKRELYV